MSEQGDRPIFELRRLPEKTDDALLTELRRVATLAPDQPLTTSRFAKHGRVSRKFYNERFGSWAGALEAAGLSDQSTNKKVTRGAHPSRNMSDEKILEQLRELASRLGVTQLTARHLREQDNLPFSDATLRKRWGTTQAAFIAAGLSTSLLGRRYDDEDCYKNLLVVWTHFGRPPMYQEMGLPPSIVGGKAYTLRFGTWNKALTAFVDQINNDTAPARQQAEVSSSAGDEKFIHRRASSQEDARDIPLGLRFRVLHRDRFKCVLCGDHPARNPDCCLHVDHISPWSKGGRTREDNLRTLCAFCNVGRGNRFVT